MIANRVERDCLRALQYAYYVQKISLVPDDFFDKEEKKLKRPLPVGSEDPRDYSRAERALALYLVAVFYEENKKHLL